MKNRRKTGTQTGAAWNIRTGEIESISNTFIARKHPPETAEWTGREFQSSGACRNEGDVIVPSGAIIHGRIKNWQNKNGFNF